MMKYKVTILKAAAMLLLVSHLASCAKHYTTDNKRPPKHKYQRAGRAW